MKVTIEVDCTPEEARRVMGLPDLTPLHDQYLAMMGDTMKNGIRPEQLETMIKNWSPMGDASLTFWRRLFENSAKPGG